MDKYNLIIIGFIVVTFFVALWWAFNTVRRIEAQKNFCAMPLSSIAKLWRRANFVPEDAKERESLYLYRDFLRKFDVNECMYPILVKDGGVRCMSRKEYDDMCGQKTILPVSILLTIMSVLIAVAAVLVNIFVTKTLWIGISLALIMPVVQIALTIFVARFNKDKDNYRDGIFMALRENSVAFLRITKPFIIVDAYPQKFGRAKKPLYTTIGHISEKQVIETRDFIVRQKEAETKIVMSNVNNDQEIQRITDKTTKKPTHKLISNVAAKAAAETTTTENDTANNTAKTTETTPAPTKWVPIRGFSDEDKENLINNLMDDYFKAEVDREIKKAEQAEQTVEEVETLAPLPTDALTGTFDVEAPAEDDFSLDAIGQALDAEIAKRNKKK